MRHFDEFSNNVLYFLKWITIFEVAEKVIHNVIDIVITDRCLYCNWKRFFFLGLVFTCSSIIAVLQDWLCVLMSSPESNRIIVHFPFIFSPFSTYFCHLLTTDPVSAIMGKMTHGCWESWDTQTQQFFLIPIWWQMILRTTWKIVHNRSWHRSVFSSGIWTMRVGIKHKLVGFVDYIFNFYMLDKS